MSAQAYAQNINDSIRQVREWECRLAPHDREAHDAIDLLYLAILAGPCSDHFPCGPDALLAAMNNAAKFVNSRIENPPPHPIDTMLQSIARAFADEYSKQRGDKAPESDDE